MRTRTVAVALASCGLAAAFMATHAAVASADTAITITTGGCTGGGTQYCFTPESAAGTVGVAVTWTNQSGAPHTVTSCDATNCPGAPANTGSDTFNVTVPPTSGGTASFTFTSSGTYTYYCMIHGYVAMHGTITISPSQPNVPDLLHPWWVIPFAGAAGVLGLGWMRRRREV